MTAYFATLSHEKAEARILAQVAGVDETYCYRLPHVEPTYLIGCSSRSLTALELDAVCDQVIQDARSVEAMLGDLELPNLVE